MASNPFTKKLLRWHSTISRNMPWKKTRDPYKIWLSEIILQQTRVEQGTPYYLKMVKHFPNIKSLAEADEEEVLHAWQGLGYYSRARNMHSAALQIMRERGGRFPETYDEILRLKGVGPYTAAAIASFAFGLPYAVVDGNVYRVLSRAFGIREDITSTKAKRRFNELANQLLDERNAGAFNQALMDFGALTCTSAAPDCKHCFYRNSCYAFRNQLVNVLPVKAKKQDIKQRWLHFLVFEKDELVAIEKRSANDIWKGLYQFPLIEHSSLLSEKEVFSFISKNSYPPKSMLSLQASSDLIQHKLSHQTLNARFYRIKLKAAKVDQSPGHWKWVKRSALKNYAFPKLIEEYSRKYLA